MGLLSLDGKPFSVGWARYFTSNESGVEDAGKIWVTVRHPSVKEFSFLAELDTGAPWTLLHAELADELDLFAEDGEPAHTRTAYGPIDGVLVRTPLILIPFEGQEVRVDATVLVSEDWKGPSLLGMTGFLERLRFAVDPGTDRFHFGPL